MSVETILRNVYSYLEVLEAAHSDVVRHWSEDSLENSLKWAHYCEQVLAYLLFHFHKSHTLFHVHRFSAWFWCCRLASVFEIGVYSYKAKSPFYSFITEKVVWP